MANETSSRMQLTNKLMHRVVKDKLTYLCHYSDVYLVQSEVMDLMDEMGIPRKHTMMVEEFTCQISGRQMYDMPFSRINAMSEDGYQNDAHKKIKKAFREAQQC